MHARKKYLPDVLLLTSFASSFDSAVISECDGAGCRLGVDVRAHSADPAALRVPGGDTGREMRPTGPASVGERRQTGRVGVSERRVDADHTDRDATVGAVSQNQRPVRQVSRSAGHDRATACTQSHHRPPARCVK